MNWQRANRESIQHYREKKAVKLFDVTPEISLWRGIYFEYRLIWDTPEQVFISRDYGNPKDAVRDLQG
jgi:hypothetical protein